MRPQFRFSPPRRADGTLLPAASAFALALLATSQIVLGGDIDETALAVPPAGRDAGLIAPVPQSAPVVVPPVLLSRNIFSDAPAGGASDSDAAPPPLLGGAVVAGSARVGRRAYAVVQLPGGGLRRLPVGGTIGGWRLVRLSETNAVFVRGRQRLELPFGAQPTSPAPTDLQGETDR